MDRQTAFLPLLKLIYLMGALILFPLFPCFLRAEDKSILVRQKGSVAWALIVSAKKYKDDNIPELTWPDKDADDLDKLLKAQGYTTIVLSTRTDDLKKVSERDTILAKLKLLKENAGPQDLILFYFSGHGYSNPDAKGIQGNFIIPYDAKVENAGGSVVIRNGIAVAEIQALLEGSRARQRVIIIDACRNDPNKRALAGPTVGFRPEKYREAEGTFLMFGTAPGTEAEDPNPEHDTKYKNGLFTHYLIKGLEGQAADPEGTVTFDTLKNYVFEQMKKASVQRGHVQTPYVALGDNTTYTIAMASYRTTHRSDLPSTPSPSRPSRWDDVWRSAVLPGWGQFHQSRPNSGAAYSALFFGGLAAHLRARQSYLDAQNNYSANITPFLLSQTGNGLLLNSIYYQEKRADISRTAHTANVTLGLVALFYCLNLLDSGLHFNGPASDRTSASASITPELVISSGQDHYRAVTEGKGQALELHLSVRF